MNLTLLFALAAIRRRAIDVAVHLRQDGAERVLYVSRGKLVGGQSNLPEERIGRLLAEEGVLDPLLVEPTAEEAKRQKRTIGEQLLADGLISPTQLASALERQALRRFDSALTSAASVEVREVTGQHGLLQRPLGALVVRAFREKLPVEAAEAFFNRRPLSARKLELTQELQDELGLLPAELRLCRRLAAGESPAQLAQGAPSQEAVVRLLAALVALDLWA